MESAEIVSAPEHLAALQNEVPSFPGGARRLVERFVAGQDWLAMVRVALGGQSDAGVGSRIERRYVEGLDQLVALENLLRFTYPEFAGCARADLGPCDLPGVLRCQTCATYAKQEGAP